ncbi:MAG: oligosaccharide flippase family protein [Desulfatiglandales bacterium]
MIPNLFIPGFSKSLHSISFLWLGGLVAGLLSFLTQIILARYLSLGDYGAFSAAYRLICILAPVAGFGVGAYWLRRFGKEGIEGRRWLNPSFKLVAVTTCSAIGIILGVGSVAGFDEDVRILIHRLAPVVLFWASTELVRARFQLEARYRTLALWDTLFSLTGLVVACLLVLSRKGLYFLSAGYATGALAIAVLGGMILYRMAAGPFSPAGHPAAGGTDVERFRNVPTVAAVLKGTLPFALDGIFYMVYFQIGVVMVGWFDGSSSAGMYNVAITILSAVYLLPGVVYQKFLIPKIQRWAEHDRGRLIEVYSFGNGAMFLCGLFFMLCVLISVWTVVPWFFGPRYAESGRILLVLCIAVPIRFLSANVGSTLVTGEHMRRKNLYQGVGALLNILLNLFLIPMLGFYGAALSAVLTEGLILALYASGVRNHVLGPGVWRSWSFRPGGHDHHG